MIRVNDDNIMISKKDVVNKYFYLPDYVFNSGDKFYFTVSKLNEDKTKTVKLNIEMQVESDDDGKCFLKLNIPSQQINALNEENYIYDIRYVSGTDEFTLNYPKLFIVKGVAHDV